MIELPLGSSENQLVHSKHLVTGTWLINMVEIWMISILGGTVVGCQRTWYLDDLYYFIYMHIMVDFVSSNTSSLKLGRWRTG